MSEQFWHIKEKALVWDVKKEKAHSDNIEMSGLYCDCIVNYGIRENSTLLLSQVCYFPMFRTIPNNTHATFSFPLDQENRFLLCQNGTVCTEYPTQFILDGTLRIHSTTNNIQIDRCLFPSVDSRFVIELITLQSDIQTVLTPSIPSETTHAYNKGTKGIYLSKIYHTAPQTITLTPKKPFTFAVFYTAILANESVSLPNATEELQKRRNRVSELCDRSLMLDTGIPELDTMMHFAKLRAGESIFDTLTGKYHSPGGGRYYAATWCNDQIEYAGPHFAMTGDKIAIEASENAYRSYIPFMSDAYIRIPSSVIAEGLDIWEGVGDRGDAAMYLYGASIFCLYLGDQTVAEKLYDAIRWCAEYCERQKSPEGIIRSDTDELEKRIPTDGYANLSTSSLCYGGLLHAAKLARALEDHKTADCYLARAAELEKSIESYFGAELHGFETYRYSKGFDTLRAWICLPLCMGIRTREQGTLAAMLSPYLWTEEGMLTCEHSSENTTDTIWDRSTLYGMKCAFAMGAGDIMLPHLLRYCKKRLLCDRVPYAVEAYPEGNKRHLAGESALFVRLVTEGLFGISPESFTAFSFLPNLPKDLDHMKLSDIRICGTKFTIEIDRKKWTVTTEGQVLAQGVPNGQRVMIHRPK